MKILFLTDKEWESLNERLKRLEEAAFMDVYTPHSMGGLTIPVSEFCKEIYYQENLEWVRPTSTPGHFRKRKE